MKSVLKKYMLNIIWILLFAAIAIFMCFTQGFNEIIDTLAQAEIRWIVLALALMLSYYLLEGSNLYDLTHFQSKHYKYTNAVVNAVSGTFFNGITPFASGGQFAQVYVFNKQGVKPALSAGILLMNFIIYQTTMVSYSFIVLLFKFSYFVNELNSFFSLSLIGFTVNLCVITTLYLGAKSHRFQNFLCHKCLWLLYKLRFIKHYEELSFKLETQIKDFRTQLNLLTTNRRVMFKAFFFCFLKLTVLYCIPYCCFRAIWVEVSISRIFDMIAITSFIYMITAFIPIPGASGGSEGTFVLMFGSLLGGVHASSAMIIWRFVTYYFGLIVGGLTFSLNKQINRIEVEEE